MRMSRRGREALIQREGVRTKAYQDSVGVWTIGVGHTSAAGEPHVHPGLSITRQQVDEILSRDLVQYENAVNKAVEVPLRQNEFDALVSLAFNIGVGGISRSTVVRKLNMGDRKGAADAFLLWNKPPEIMGRRRSERQQFLTPYLGEAPPDVEPVPEKPTKPKTVQSSKTIWAAITSFLGTLMASLADADWKVWAVIIVGALLAFIIVDRILKIKRFGI